ncbi:Bifunctional inhibitor/lipid-transfer protein/seed storage 2S albumin superfamily protein [Euphorbia peplus]|nr:Bifunctional inhibitor/lipid-transfer protein/seed storage 2S albumin superfamily protein [Euphorbia peplus]
MKGFSFSCMKVVAAAAIMVAIFSEIHMSEAVTCDVMQLVSCAPAMSSDVPPPSSCCSNLKAQQPCFCGYMKDPSLKQYISSPGAKRVAKDCGIAIPAC